MLPPGPPNSGTTGANGTTPILLTRKPFWKFNFEVNFRRYSRGIFRESACTSLAASKFLHKIVAPKHRKSENGSHFSHFLLKLAISKDYIPISFTSSDDFNPINNALLILREIIGYRLQTDACEKVNFQTSDREAEGGGVVVRRRKIYSGALTVRRRSYRGRTPICN